MLYVIKVTYHAYCDQTPVRGVVLAFLIFYVPSFLSTLFSVLQLHITQSQGNTGPAFYHPSEKTTRSILILLY